MTILFFSIAVAILLGIGIFSLFFSKKAIVKRKLKKAPVIKTANFIDGDIGKITGKIELAGDALIAPLSGRACAYYHVLIEKKVSSGNSSSWHTIIDKEAHCRFVIRDGNRVAYIDDYRVRNYIVKDKDYSSGFLDDPKPHLEKFLRDNGQKSTGFFGMNHTIRYKEGILETGELVSVYGEGTWKKAADLELPESYDRVLAISAPKGDYVYLSDDVDTVKNKAPEY